LTRRFYPNPQYDNHVDDILEITDLNAKKVVVEAYRVRYNWNGSGKEDWGWIAIDVSVFQETPDFLYRDTIEQIIDATDFEELVESIIKFVIDYAIEMNVFAW